MTAANDPLRVKPFRAKAADLQLVGSALIGNEKATLSALRRGGEPSLTVTGKPQGDREVPVPVAVRVAQWAMLRGEREEAAWRICKLLIERTRETRSDAFELVSVFEQRVGEGPARHEIRFVDPLLPDAQITVGADKPLFEALFRLVPRAYRETVQSEAVTQAAEAASEGTEPESRRTRRRLGG
jgi:hypothetical protein